MGIQPINFSMHNSNVDWEEQQIIKRLQAYGVTPTGNKSIDKATLHKLEVQDVKKSSHVENKFLTVSPEEQEKIHEEKNKNKSDFNPDVNVNSMDGAKLLGEQLYLAIQMKKKKGI
ncbi:MAG: hypothetical protein MJ231_07035 [bacterium]|nr:hypothetical protein [bacterium]